MKKYKSLIKLLIIFTILVLFDNIAFSKINKLTENYKPKKELYFGVYAHLGYERTYNKYKPIVDYLNEELVDEHINLKVLPMDELNLAVENRSIDFLTTNPTHFLLIREKYKLTGVIATLVTSSKTGVHTNQLGGVIVCKANRNDINTLADIRGKIVATPNIGNTGGYHTQVYELYKYGIKIPKELKQLIISTTHQKSIEMLLNDKCDVAFVRTGIIEEMKNDNIYLLDSIKVINSLRFDGFPYLVSTQLYPEWPVIGLPHVSEEHIRHIASALYKLDNDNPYAIKAGIYGYSIPSDYKSVEELARELRLAPFDVTPEFTLTDIWDKYSLSIILGLIIIIFGIILIIIQIVAVKKVNNEKRRYKNLLSSIGEGVFSVDRNGYCTQINEMALKELEFEEKDFEGKNFLQIIFNKTNKDITNPKKEYKIFNTILDGKPRIIEDIFYKKSGKTFDVELVINPIYEKNVITGAIVSFKDISQRKEYESEILKLSQAVEQSPVSIVITDLETKIQYVNSAFELTTGYSFDELKGKPPGFLLFDNSSDNKYEELWENLYNKKTWKGTFLNKKKDGSTYWNSIYVTPIINSDNEIVHFLGISEDITLAQQAEEKMLKFSKELEKANSELISEIEYRKTIEKKLIENELKLKRIFEIIPVGINIIDGSGKYIEVNSAAEKILGINRNEIINKKYNLTKWKIIKTDGSVMPENEFASVRAKNENRFIKDFVVGAQNKENGEIIWLNVNAIPMDLEEQSVLITYIDITTMMQAEKELSKINEELIANQSIFVENQFLLNKTIEELEESKTELQEINSTKDKFFSIIAHDLRSPFSGFLGLTKLLVDEINELSADDIKSYVSIIKDSAENLYNLLENLLEWAVIQKGNKRFNPDYFNLLYIVKNNYEIIKAKAIDKNISFNIDINKEFTAYVDGNMLNAILRNLISNAIKFSNPDSMIDIEAKDLNEFIQISIKDKGIGMSQDLVKKLFIVGEKTSRQGTSGEPSTGLGLVLVKEYVERNGGEIWVESEENIGSTFHFTLPKVIN